MSGTRERADGGSPPGFPHPVCIPDETGHCGVCGDRGLVARVLEVLDDGPAARVRLEEPGREGEEAEVALDLLGGVAPGDRIVVHMGFAIAAVREHDVDRGSARDARSGRTRSPGSDVAGETGSAR